MVSKSEKNSKEWLEEVGGISELDDLLEKMPSVALYYEADRLARAENGSDEARDLLRSLKADYRSGLLYRRNALAHGKEVRTDDGFQVPRKNAKPLTRTDFVRFRADFGRILGQVTDLHGLLIVEKP